MCTSAWCCVFQYPPATPVYEQPLTTTVRLSIPALHTHALRDMYDDCVGATSIVLPPGGYVGRLRQSPTAPKHPPPQPQAAPPSAQPSVASPFDAPNIGPNLSTLPPAIPEHAPSFAAGGGSATSPFESADSSTIALSVLPVQAPPLEEAGSAGPLEQIGSELPITPPSQADELAYYQHVERFLGALRGARWAAEVSQRSRAVVSECECVCLSGGYS